MAQPQEEAAGYYNQQPQPGYQSQQPQEMKSGYAPPTYGQDFHMPQDNKQSFEQTFKVEKPKLNDLWAGILVSSFGSTASIHTDSCATFSICSRFLRFRRNLRLDDTLLFDASFILRRRHLQWRQRLLTQHQHSDPLCLRADSHIRGIICIFHGSTCLYEAVHLDHWYPELCFCAGNRHLLSVPKTMGSRDRLSHLRNVRNNILRQLDTAHSVQRCHAPDKYGCGDILVSLIGGLASIVFGAWFSVTLVAVYVAHEPGNAGSNLNPACSESGSCSTAKVIGLVVFITFAGYWITECIKNTIHTTIAGIYGSWYFCAGKPGGMPHGLTIGAFKPATTHSFDCISFGSLS